MKSQIEKQQGVTDVYGGLVLVGVVRVDVVERLRHRWVPVGAGEVDCNYEVQLHSASGGEVAI